MSITIKEFTEQTPASIKIGGELTVQYASEIREGLLESFDRMAPGPVILDFSGVVACDTAGVQLFLFFVDNDTCKGCTFDLKTPPPQIVRAAEYIGVFLDH